MKTKNTLFAVVAFAFVLTGCANTTDALRTGGVREDIIVIRPESQQPVGATTGDNALFGGVREDIIVIRPE